MKYRNIGIIVVVLLIAGGIIWFFAARPQQANVPAAENSMAETASQQPAEGTFQIITAEDAKKMMDEGNVTIVDVRRQDEYDAGHVKGAILVSNESIGSTAPEALPGKDAVLLVYCRTGIRAADASQKLADLGYTHVYDFGGIQDWPYETEK